jgi:competence protein ComEA
MANGLLHPNCVSVSNHIEELQEPAEDSLAGDGPEENASPSLAGRSQWLRLVAFLLGAYAVFWLGSWAAIRSSKPPLVGPISAQRTSALAPKVVVHVTGRVHRPGVYTLGTDARVQDAVRRAGGPLPDADVNAINLASWAEDGPRIEVPAKPKATASSDTRLATAPVLSEPFAEEDQPIAANAQVEPNAEPDKRAASSSANASTPRIQSRKTARATKAKKPKAAKPTTIAGMPRALTAAGKPSDNASPEFLEKHPLNLNTANAAQLEALPGVGPAMSQKILETRKQNGGFKSVDELDEVPGIGPKKMEALRPLIDVK